MADNTVLDSALQPVDDGHKHGTDAKREADALHRAKEHGFNLVRIIGGGYYLTTSDPMSLSGICEWYLDPMDRGSPPDEQRRLRRLVEVCGGNEEAQS